MDDLDDDLTPELQCDVEMQLSGPNNGTLNKWAADALRRLADRIERDELDSGWHDVMDNVGKKIGKVYLDHTGSITRE